GPPASCAVAGHFGETVVSLGDTNTDGYADIAVAAPTCTTPQVDVFVGGPSGLVGMAQIVGDPGTTLEDAFGRGLGGPGDVNGDGRADLVVGAYQYPFDSTTGAGPGALYYFPATAAGFIAVPARRTEPAAVPAASFGQFVAVRDPVRRRRWW